MNFNRIVRSGVMVVMAFSTMFGMASVPVSAASNAQASAGAFTVGKCPFKFASDPKQVEGKTYKCGMVTVPEDHSKPTGKTIQLAVAVFKATAQKPQADPVIYLQGGPGGPLINDGANWYSTFQALTDSRDLILFDQRGTGLSKPNLDCPELTKLGYDSLPLVISQTESAKKQTDTTLVCQKRLVSEGVNLSLYNTDQNAADVDAIRQALGYKTVDLYGISYGTLLALVTMRDYPQGVRSAIIDSVVPPEEPMEVQQIPATERVFKQLWDGCKADADCNKAYPNLEKVFYATVDKLNKKPVTINKVPSSISKDTYTVAVDGNALINVLFQTFYVTPYIPSLPAVIYAASKGNLTTIASLALYFFESGNDVSLGMYFSVNCRERMAYETMAQVNAAATGVPQEMLDNQLPGLQSEFDICAAWGAGKAPAIDEQPITSKIPTLVMAGLYDPVTPPSYSKQVADELGNAYYFELPNSGHGASLSGDCAFGLVTSFLDAPDTKPDGSCIDSVGPPQWKTPASP